MKHTIISLFFFVPFIHSFEHYQTYARNWVNTYLVDYNGNLRISVDDLALVRSVLESSYAKSVAVLQLQEKGAQTLNAVWSEWNNLLQTRLNPGNERPHDLDYSQCNDLTQQFWQEALAYKQATQSYDDIVKQVVHGTALQTTLAHESLTAARAQARVYMLESLADARAHLEALYTLVFKQYSDIQTVVDEVDESRLASLSSFLMNYVPSLAINTFIHADSMHAKVSNEGWDVLYTMQEIGNQAWKAIEVARSNFYLALLQAVDSYIS